MVNLGRHNVLGILVDAVDYDAVVQRIMQAATERRGLTVGALAVHGIMCGALDPVHRFRLNAFDLVVPDGQPVRWALRLLHGVGLVERVYGPTLMARVCARAAADGVPIFLFGTTDALLGTLRQRLEARYPGLIIAGHRPSRFRRLATAERDEVITEIRESGAAITFVGLGCPRQEVWAYECRDALGMPIITVGAAFAFHAGTLTQAPPILGDYGLEWLFRLIAEPARLWRRYLVLNPLYLTLLALQLSRARRFDPADAVRPQDDLLYG